MDKVNSQKSNLPLPPALEVPHAIEAASLDLDSESSRGIWWENLIARQREAMMG